MFDYVKSDFPKISAGTKSTAPFHMSLCDETKTITNSHKGIICQEIKVPLLHVGQSEYDN